MFAPEKFTLPKGKVCPSNHHFFRGELVSFGPVLGSKGRLIQKLIVAFINISVVVGNVYFKNLGEWITVRYTDNQSSNAGIAWTLKQLIAWSGNFWLTPCKRVFAPKKWFNERWFQKLFAFSPLPGVVLIQFEWVGSTTDYLWTQKKAWEIKVLAT